jgi:bifunctional non-homologous end joining protein LigD
VALDFKSAEIRARVIHSMTEKNLIEILPEGMRKTVRSEACPKWVSPMLATLTEERFSREGWLFEEKFDGERCLVLKSGKEIQLFSRNRKRLDDRYPELVTAFGAQRAERFAVDGEIVAMDGQVTSFSKLQLRMQVRNPPSKLRRDVPVWIFLFDLLHLGAYDTRQLPLRSRKELLRKALKFEGALRFTEHRETEGEKCYREACRKRWEGIIAKDAESVYVSKRSRAWLKFKCAEEQEFIIAGYTDPRGHRIGFGALLVGYYQGKKLVYAGKVGTGFDEETLQRMGRQLAALEIKENPFASGDPPGRGVHWVKPKLVAQIGFAEWTRGGKLRHPRFLGLRDDKTASEVVKEH